MAGLQQGVLSGRQDRLNQAHFYLKFLPADLVQPVDLQNANSPFSFFILGFTFH
ncbi:MAG: hypothetical protein ACJAWN_002352 [Neolewinella sp.]